MYVDFDGGCCATKRRSDLRTTSHNTIIAIEIHEDQHKQYVKKNEDVRYDDLFLDFSGKYMFIHFNPDN